MTKIKQEQVREIPGDLREYSVTDDIESVLGRGDVQYQTQQVQLIKKRSTQP